MRLIAEAGRLAHTHKDLVDRTYTQSVQTHTHTNGSHKVDVNI